MLKAFPRILVVWSALSLPAVVWAERVDMQEGEWEVTVETTFEGGPMSLPPMTSRTTNCLTREDVVPSAGEQSDCKVTKQKIVGNRVSWSIVCGKGEGEGEITYRGTSYSGRMKVKTVDEGTAMTSVMKLQGRYLGPCRGGNKSAAGQTDVDKYKAMGEQAIAQAKQARAEQDAAARKGEEVLKSAVPAEEPGACTQADFARRLQCEEKVGKLQLEWGQYEVVTERATRMGATVTPPEVKRQVVCVNEDDPVPAMILTGGQAREVKRGKEKITWTHKDPQIQLKGGILYRGTSFEGVVSQAMDLSPQMKSLEVTRVTGKRIGDGNCTKGRELRGREYTTQPRDDSLEGRTKEILNNPVKGIRGLFGF